MAKLIGTAGHVDHGKTSLIRALTGIDADRLPEEKERGLTIDLGFAHMDLPGIGRVSIIDVPGHERFLSNMLIGVQGVDVAILCVAAHESVKPQTVEHFQILDLLPVESLVIALTFADLATDTDLAKTRADVIELLNSTRFEGSDMYPVSALTGLGLVELKAGLAEKLKVEKEPKRGAWYLPIDRVFSVKGHGAVVTGTLMQGEVRVGDEVEIQPGGLAARVRQIQAHDQTLEFSTAGQRTALNLAGLKEEDLRRGQLAGQPGTVFETRLIDAEVRWIEKPKWGLRVRVSIGADEVIGRAYPSDLNPSQVQLRLEEPTGAVARQALIIRRYSPPDLLGGGLVLVAEGKVGKKSAVPVQSKELSLEEQVVEIICSAQKGIETGEICRLVGQTSQTLGDVFESLISDGKVVGFAGYWFDPQNWETTKAHFVDTLDAMHDAEPKQLYFAKEQVAKTAGIFCPQKSLDRIIAQLVDSLLIRASAKGIGLTNRSAQLNPAQRQLLDRIKEEFEKGRWTPPSPADVAKELRIPSHAVTSVLSLGIELGEVVRLDETIWFTRKQFLEMLSEARAFFGSNKFTASEFRSKFETSRKYAIPILEYMDAKRITFRQGDSRFFIQTN